MGFKFSLVPYIAIKYLAVNVAIDINVCMHTYSGFEVVILYSRMYFIVPVPNHIMFLHVSQKSVWSAKWYNYRHNTTNNSNIRSILLGCGLQ